MGIYTDYLVQSFMIILPVLMAGIFFIFVLKRGYFSWLNRPVDFGATFQGRRVFGDNKTWRGFVVMPAGTFVSILAVSGILRLAGIDINLVMFDYHWEESYKAIIYGLAYPVGELPNSFLKRQLGINPGKKADTSGKKYLFNFLDKVDAIFSCAFVLFFLYNIPVVYLAGAFGLGWFFHQLTDYVMLTLRLKQC